MAKPKTLSEILSAAITDVVDHGFDKPERMEKWLEAIRAAAKRSLPSEKQMEKMLRDALVARYKKLVDGGEIARLNPGVAKFTIDDLTPKMRDELTKRIMASANLIKLNRKRSIDETLQRFSGWMSSIPAGGTEQAKKREVKEDVGKALSSLPFTDRRVIVDQSHKLVSSINSVVAVNTGAIAGRWHSNFRQPGYDARPDHEHRDGEVFAIRGNWAIEKGLMKAGPNGFTDDIEQPAELPFCRCSYVYLHNLRSLPDDMITRKGKEALSDARAKTAV